MPISDHTMRSIFLAVLPSLCLAQGAGIDLRTLALPPAIVHKPYSPAPLVAAGGGRCLPNLIGFAVVRGQLPPGITLSAAGFLSGMPTAEGVYSFSVRAQNECVSMTRSYRLDVQGPPILELAPARIEFRYQTGGALPEPQTLRVAANSQGLAYSVETEGAAWLQIRPMLGRTPPEGSALRHDVVELMVDPAGLQPGEYRVRLRAEAWQAATSPSALVVLKITGRSWE